MNSESLSELPKGWVWTRLGEIMAFEYGKGLTADKREQKGNVPVYGSNGIVGYHSIPLIEKPCLIIGRKGAAGYVHISKIPCWPIDTTYYIIPPDELDLAFLYYLLSTLNLNSLDKSTAIPGLNRNDAYALKISLPPLPEQRRIVTKIEELFTNLDAGVSALKKSQAQLKRYRQSVLKAACEGKLVPTEAELARVEGRTYEPADVLLERILKERREKWKGKGKYKEPAAPEANGLPALPEGWGWARLDSLAALKGGITKDENRKVANARKIPYLRVANVQRGYLDLSEIKEIDASESIISELLLKPGDILFTEGGDRDKLGRGCVWNGEILECIHQNHIFRARLYSSDISNKIISWFGNTHGQSYFIREGKQTTNLASINLTKLNAFPIPIPPFAEQRRIVLEVERRLSVADEVARTAEQSLTHAERLRQSILKKAFEGRLVPQDANDEPAGVLLERIKQERARMGVGKKRQKVY